MRELELHEAFEMEALDIMRRQRALDKLVFCGGTMLRLCFGLKRYSVDLDFHVAKGKNYRGEFIGMKGAFEKVGFEITDHQEKAFTYLIELRGKNYPRRLKIEIRKQSSGDLMVMQNIAFSENSPSLQVKLVTCTLEQMWKDKIRTYLDRGEIRDVFDIEFLLRKGAGKIEDMDKETLNRILKGLTGFNERDFRNTLGNLLAPEDRKFWAENKFSLLRGALQSALIK